MNHPLDYWQAIRNLVLRRPSRRLPILSLGQVESVVGRLPAAVIPKVLHQIWLGPSGRPSRRVDR